MKDQRKRKFPVLKTFCLMVLSFVLCACGGPVVSREAAETFQSSTEPFTVTVYPIRVVRGESIDLDAGLVQKLAAFLEEEKVAAPITSETSVDFPVTWGMNQAKMLRGSAAAFSRHVGAEGVDTDFALMVEILCNPDESRVLGVHYYLADREGRIADCGLSNSHHREFKQVNPTDRDGGYEVLVATLRSHWDWRMEQ